MDTLTASLKPLVPHFLVRGTLTKAEPFGSGLIHETYLCECAEEHGKTRRYLLQQINTTVFPKPDLMMANVETVTFHIVDKLRFSGVRYPARVAPVLVHTKEGDPSYRDPENRYWRMFHFIESCRVYDIVDTPALAGEIGRGLGSFHRLVSDLMPLKLHDILPDFHRTPRHLLNYHEAVSADVLKRAGDVTDEQEFIERRRRLAPALTTPLANGKVPLRVVHNDPKVNNVLIHTETGKAVCMVDLDTVMPGTALYDFGDCARSAANPAGEDVADPRQAAIDLTFFEAITRGYLRETGDFLTDREVDMLPLSVKVITFELGVRFLTDHLQGDRYFKIRYSGHNLHRARVQFRLLESIEKAEEQMASIVRTSASSLHPA